MAHLYRVPHLDLQEQQQPQLEEVAPVIIDNDHQNEVDPIRVVGLPVGLALTHALVPGRVPQVRRPIQIKHPHMGQEIDHAPDQSLAPHPVMVTNLHPT